MDQRNSDMSLKKPSIKQRHVPHPFKFKRSLRAHCTRGAADKAAHNQSEGGQNDNLSRLRKRSSAGCVTMPHLANYGENRWHRGRDKWNLAEEVLVGMSILCSDPAKPAPASRSLAYAVELDEIEEERLLRRGCGDRMEM